MTNKILKKLAVIRSENKKGCPFGLPIIDACQSVGATIRQMMPLDMDGSKESNLDILLWYGTGDKCPFANEIMQEQEAVQCSFSVEKGTHLPTGSPYYHKEFSTTTWNGTFSEPQGYYNPQSTDRGMYYGQYSVEGQSKEKKK